MTQKTPNPHLTALIKHKGVTALARELGVTTATIYTWIGKGFVPVRKLTAFCNALDIDLSLDLCSRPDEVSAGKPTLNKPKGTLECLVEVQRGNMSIDEAASQLGVSAHALQIAYSQNEHRLFLLYSTLTAFSEGRISAEEAAKALGVSKTQVYYLMRTYGVERPQREAPAKKVGRYTQNKSVYEKTTVDVVAGRTSAKVAAEENSEISERTLHRYIKKAIEPHSLTELSHWPQSFRLALANEIEENGPKYVGKWADFAKKHGFVLEKRVRRLPEVKNWREVRPERLLIAVFQGEATLDEIVELRRGAKKPIIDAFNGVLKALGLDYSKACSLSVAHQMAIADLLIIQGSHYRRVA